MNAKDIITWVESQVVDISNEQHMLDFFLVLWYDRDNSIMRNHCAKVTGVCCLWRGWFC